MWPRKDTMDTFIETYDVVCLAEPPEECQTRAE